MANRDRASDMELRATSLDHPDAAALVGRLQAYYQSIYGGQDETPHDAAEFLPPSGYFVVGYVDDAAVACGGWRARDDTDPPLLPGDAEIKRMFVEPARRGRGYARALLADLEAAAARAGRRRMVLETAVRQPEAIGLYLRAGYASMPPFGTYRDTPEGRYFARMLPGVIAPDDG
jgi:GNAT superfamily N-acetyltransferase